MARRARSVEDRKRRKSVRSAAPSGPALEPLEPSPAWIRWTAALLIMAATVAAYWNTLDNDFVTWDDDKYIRQNSLVKDNKPLSAIWFRSEEDAGKLHYYPLVYTTYWLEHRLAGLNPRVFHADQMILHGLNAAILVFVMRWLGAGLFVSIATGAIFALHPTNVASVAWAAERKNTLSCLFYLLSMLLYLQYRRRSDMWRYVLSIGCFLLALLAKSAVLMLAPILVLTDRVLDRRWTLASLGRTVPYFALAATFAGLTMLHEAGLVKESDNPVHMALRPLIAARALVHYFTKVLVPVGLVPIYPRWPESFAKPIYWISLVVVLAGALLLWRYRKRIDRYYFWGLTVFLLSIAPVLGLKHYNLVQFTFVADHYMYLGAQGLFLIVALLLDRLRRTWLHPGADPSTRRVSSGRSVAVSILLALALGACAFLTTRHNRIYKNGVTFWEYTLARNPDCMPGNLNLGNHYMREKDYARALPYYRQAVRLLPNHVNVPRSAAGCAKMLGLEDEAIGFLQRALDNARRKGPNLTTQVQLELGDYLRSIGRTADALAHYQEILARDPDNQGALRGLERAQGP